jgi:hypothetical protein
VYGGDASFRECAFEWYNMFLNKTKGVEMINELVT